MGTALAPVLICDCMSVRDCAYSPVPHTTERFAMIDIGCLVEAVERRDIEALLWLDRWRMVADDQDFKIICMSIFKNIFNNMFNNSHY